MPFEPKPKALSKLLNMKQQQLTEPSSEKRKTLYYIIVMHQKQLTDASLEVRKKGNYFNLNEICGVYIYSNGIILMIAF